MSLKKGNRLKSLSLCDDFPLRSPRSKSLVSSKKLEDTTKTMKYIDDNIIGKGVAFLGPYGRRKVVYADYSSSGRSIQFLEDYIIKEVLPAYGDNTCTSAVTGLQSHLFNNESRQLIKSSVNASDEDEVVFCDGACTSPAERICNLLCYQYKHELDSENDDNQKQESPVLFVSTCEPIKNLKPWIDAGVQIETISKTRDGFLDLVNLEKTLLNFVDSKRRLIGLFSGASRLTGILSDDVATTILLHQYGALSIWDYSPAAPSTQINVNPSLPGSTKDALFFSANKFIGGAQAPGILILKKNLLTNCGSTLNDTVGVIGAVRAGLVIQLKESLGIQAIMARQEKICKQILSHIRTIPEIVLLGPSCTSIKRLPILCFLVRHSRGAFLHHRFVVAVLNDVFGIQATVGNHIGEALGINGKLIVDYERLLADDSLKIESIRPGYIKIFFPFFMCEAEVGFIMEALKMIATEAWKLLPQYEVDDSTGEWRHHSNSLAKERKLLGAIRYTDGKMLFSDRRISGPGAFPQNYSDSLQTARNLFNRSRKMAQKSALSETVAIRLNRDKAEALRWYMLPGEAHELLLGHAQNVKTTVPFDPNMIHEPPSLLIMNRHNSLSALDVRRFKSKSVPASPLQLSSDQLSPTSKSPTYRMECPSPPIVRFSLGGEVTTSMGFSPPQVTNLIATQTRSPSRNRCYSWGSTGGVSVLNSHLNLIRAQKKAAGRKLRSCSCSSQTELSSIGSYNELVNPLSLSPSLHLNSSQAGSSFSDCTEDIQAYVKEVTNELASEIKSEIREVITTVEDVLDSTENLDMNSFNLSALNNLTSAEDSVSATDVAEYLTEFSRQMTNELKTEIREAVSACDFICPETGMHRKNSPPEIVLDKPTIKGFVKHRFSDTTSDAKPVSIEFDKQRSESFPSPNTTPSWHQATASSPQNSTPNCPYTGTISKLVDSQGTASQDSGINMSFQDIDDIRSRSHSRIQIERSRALSIRTDFPDNSGNITMNKNRLSRINSDSFTEINELDISTSLPSPTRKLTIESSETDGGDSGKWQNMPKDVWKQSAEALDEFDMLKDGDKILVCLSGSSSSLCVLHALRQFSRARRIHIELGVVSIGDCGVDPRALMLYMRDLGVEYFLESQGSESLRSKLCSTARRRGYNVLAMGNTLDKLANEFLFSILNKGRLHTKQAHCANKEGDIRIIRPFIYVRERILQDFSINRKLPTRLSKTFSKPLDGSNSILKVQELVNPSVYDNIKCALRPLLSLRIEATKTSYDLIRKALNSRE